MKVDAVCAPTAIQASKTINDEIALTKITHLSKNNNLSKMSGLALGLGKQQNVHLSSGNPWHTTSLITENFHQADLRYSSDSLGSQCTMNSLCSLIYAKYFTLSSEQELDDILDAGDKLYIIKLCLN